LNSDARPASYSLRRRMLLTLLPVLAIALLLLGLSLANSYRTAAEASLFERLQLQQRLMLADVEISATGVRFPELASEPALNQPESGRFALVFDSRSQILWQSLSARASGVSWPQRLAPVLLRLNRIPQGELLTDSAAGFYLAAMRVAFALDAIETDAINPASSDALSTEVLQAGLLSDTYTLMILDDGALLAAQQKSYASSLWRWLGLTLALLATVQVLLMFWSFRPLAQLVDELRRVEQGSQQKFAASYPTEIAPLTENLNRFVEGERRQRERYKNSLADLAHSLKTPLAAMQAAIESKAGDAAMLEPVERMDAIIRYQLQRAQPLASHRMGVQRSDLALVAEPLLRTLQKVYHSKPVALDCQIPPALNVAMAEEELLELLGNVLDNAFKYCRGKVSLSASGQGAFCVVSIQDDGPGIPASRIPKVLARGGRLDQQQPGQGIGLAVAVAIVDARGGSLDIKPVLEGGARVLLRLPLATA
ncbi:MAG: hypothetical protein HKO07_00525, partial [Pseudomonadales bacterium]|nr:hypothetical protein [Pseudomonadales bacterium]